VDALTLVNEAIREAGVDLDPLLLANWANPTESMQTRFKNWVDQAWRELQTDRLEWEFQSRKGSFTIYPRVYVEFGDRATAPTNSSTFIADVTGSTFTLTSTTLLDGAWASGDAKAYVDYIDLVGQWKFDEEINEVTPTPANAVFKIEDWGAYDLASILPGLDEANESNFYIQSTGSNTDQDNDANFDPLPVMFVPWHDWANRYTSIVGAYGTPRYYTINPQGHYEFWPRPEKAYYVKCTYSGAPIGFSAATDVPELPAKLHPIIVWKAVMYYAQYDRELAVEARAKKRYGFYKRIMDRDSKPKFTYPRNRYNRG
jgi:hypothetical protein